MNKWLVIIFFLFCSAASAQSGYQKSTSKELGKVGNITISLYKTITDQDTTFMVSLSQMKSVLLSPISSGAVTILKKEIPDIISALDTFSREIDKTKPSGDINNSFATETAMVICSYDKYTGWEIMLANGNKELTDAYKKAGEKTGTIMAPMITVKPKQVDDLIKVLNKAMKTNF